MIEQAVKHVRCLARGCSDDLGVSADEGLPELPQTSIVLLKARAAREPVTSVLATHIAETFRQEVRRPERG